MSAHPPRQFNRFKLNSTMEIVGDQYGEYLLPLNGYIKEISSSGGFLTCDCDFFDYFTIYLLKLILNEKIVFKRIKIQNKHDYGFGFIFLDPFEI